MLQKGDIAPSRHNGAQFKENGIRQSCYDAAQSVSTSLIGVVFDIQFNNSDG